MTGHRLPAVAVVCAAALVAALGIALLSTGPTTAPAAVTADARAPAPVRLRIPAIGVDAPLGPLHLDPAGALLPPASAEAAGWWWEGPEPGEPGPAVIAGHVDTRTGPAVFQRLPDLGAGDEILVDRADGSTAVFATRGVERHGKDAFPTAAVYGPATDGQGAAAELRLVTCGGEFDRTRGRYLENVIVFAARTA